MPIHAITPNGLPVPPTFSRAIEVSGAGRTIYVAGIGPVDDLGNVDRPGDMVRQADVCFEKLQTILRAADASIDNMVQLTVYVTDIAQISEFHSSRSRYMSGPVLPAISGMEVSALAHPDWLIEIDGIAFVDSG